MINYGAYSKNNVVMSFFYITVGVLLFGNVVTFQFNAWDDGIHIYSNSNLTDMTYLDSIVYFWTHIHEGLYMPLTYTVWKSVWSINNAIGISQQASFHGINLILHCLNSFLVFRVLSELTFSKRLSFLSSILFLVHPLNVETFAWVSEFKGLLSFFFAGLSTYCFVLWTSSASKKTYFCSLALFLLAILSKPAVILLPILLGVIYYYRQNSILIKPLIPFVVITLPIAYVTKTAQPAFDSFTILPLYLRIFLPLHAYGFYASQLILPFPLMTVYGHTPSQVISSLTTQLYWIIGLFFVLLPYKIKSLRSIWLTMIFLLPVSGITPFSYQRYSITADRYLYLIFPILLFSMIHSLTKISSKKSQVALLSIALIYCIPLSINRMFDWKNTATLHYKNLEFDQKHEISYTNLTYFHFKQNEHEIIDSLMQNFYNYNLTAYIPQLNYALSLVQIKDYSKADSIFEKMIHTADFRFLTVVDKYTMGTQYTSLLNNKLNNPQKALIYLEPLFEAFQDSAEVYYIAGEIYVSHAKLFPHREEEYLNHAQHYFKKSIELEKEYKH